MEEETLAGESLKLAEFLNDPAVSIVAHCTKTPIPLDSGLLTLDDLDESTFGGYEPIPITQWDILPGEDEIFGEAVSSPLTFEVGAESTPELVCGLFLTIQRDADPAKLMQVFPLEVPISMEAVGRTFSRQVRLFSVDETAV